MFVFVWFFLQELRAFVSSRMKADGGLFFAPIATVHSCFKECVGGCSILVANFLVLLTSGM